MKITGKNIKSYATAQVHFPWEREGSLTAKSPNLLFKIYYPLLNFTSKLFQIGSFGQNSSELCKFRAIRPHSPRIPQNSHYLINLLYIMFQAPSLAENPAEFQRITQISRNLPTQSTNYVKFAVLLTYSILCFRHLPRQRTLRNSSELCKFHTIHPHSPRIKRNSHHLLTLHLTFQMPDQWQRTP